MKKSNKILLSILLAGFGYLTIAQIAMHKKYVNNATTSAVIYNHLVNNTYALGNIKHVRIEGVAACDIVYADSVKLAIEKSDVNYVKFRVNKDTLLLYGTTGGGRIINYKLGMSAQNTILYVPAEIDIKAINSNIKIKGNRQQAKARNYTFEISSCTLYTRFNFGFDSLNRYFDTLSVKASKRSEIVLFHNDHFNMVSLQLQRSTINDYNAKIDSLYIDADNNSTVVISGQNINRLNNTAIRK